MPHEAEETDVDWGGDVDLTPVESESDDEDSRGVSIALGTLSQPPELTASGDLLPLNLLTHKIRRDYFV